MDWELVDISPDLLTIKLDFGEPLFVSKDIDEPD